MKTKSFLTGLVVAAVVIMIAVYVFYRSRVYVSVMFGPAEWGQFGDYFGGITNPLLAFLTFLGVLWTIALTYEERKAQDLQDKKNDIFRVIEVIHAECIDILTTSKNTTAFDFFDAPKKLVDILKHCPVITGDPNNSRNWGLVHATFEHEINDIRAKLYILKALLSEFEDLTKNYYVSDYYKAFYGRYLFTLADAEILDLDKDDQLSFYFRIVHEYFGPSRSDQAGKNLE